MTNLDKIRFITVFCLSVALTACEEKIQTIDWYKTHAKERQEVIAKCNNNPGELENKPNCINARSADGQLDLIDLKATLEKLTKTSS